MAQIDLKPRLNDGLKIRYDVGITELSMNYLEEIGRKLNASSSGVRHCQRLAWKLGMGDIDERTENPGFELLQRWRSKDGSTIWVLKTYLEELGLSDVIELLEEARLDYVRIPILVYKNDGSEEINEELSSILSHERCPGLKPLIELVRPIVYSMASKQCLQFRSDQQLAFRLSTSPVKSVLNWSSPARDFQGTQVFLRGYHCKHQMQVTCKSAPPRVDSYESPECPGRRVRSWIADDLIYFESEAVDPDIGSTVNLRQEPGRRNRTPPGSGPNGSAFHATEGVPVEDASLSGTPRSIEAVQELASSQLEINLGGSKGQPSINKIVADSTNDGSENV